MNFPWSGCSRCTCFVRTFSGSARSDHASSRSSVAYSSSCVTATGSRFRVGSGRSLPELGQEDDALVLVRVRARDDVLDRLGVAEVERAVRDARVDVHEVAWADLHPTLETV